MSMTVVYNCRVSPVIIILCSILILFISPVSAYETRANLTESTWINNKDVNVNYGSDTSVYFESHTGYDRKAYMMLPSGLPTKNITLDVYFNDVTPYAYTIYIYSVNSSFDESVLTYSNSDLWLHTNPVALYSVAVTGDGWKHMSMELYDDTVSVVFSQPNGYFTGIYTTDYIDRPDLWPYITFTGELPPPPSSTINWSPDVDQTNATMFYDVDYNLSGAEHTWFEIAYYRSLWLDDHFGEYSLYTRYYADYNPYCSGSARCAIVYYQVNESGTISISDYWTNVLSSPVKWKVELINPVTSEVIDYDEIIYSSNESFEPPEPLPTVEVPEMPDMPEPTPFPTLEPTPYPTPPEVPGDTNYSINTSGMGAYYDFVNGTFAGFEGALNGVSGLVTIPVYGLINGINSANDSLSNVTDVSNRSILLDIFVPFSSMLPGKFISVISLFLCLCIVLIIFKEDD